MRILLTGAGGFLGRHLASFLSKKHELTLISGRQEFRKKLAEATGRFDLLIHAGFEVDFSQETASITRNMDSAKAVSDLMGEGRATRMLFLSGAAVMGVSKGPQERDESCFGLTDTPFASYRSCAYVRAKIGCEELFRAQNFPLTVFYPSTVYGPGMPESTLRSLQSKVAPPGGTSLLDLRDFLSAIGLYLANPLPGRFIVNGVNLSYASLLEEAQKSSGRRPWRLPAISRLALPLARPFLLTALPGYSVLESSFGYKYYSSASLTKTFGWKPLHGASEALSSVQNIPYTPTDGVIQFRRAEEE